MTSPSIPTFTARDGALAPGRPASLPEPAGVRPGVTLGPILSLVEPTSEPSGYLVLGASKVMRDAPRLDDLLWTLRAAEVLTPDSFLAADMLPETVLALGEDGDVEPGTLTRLMPILAPGRVGRGREMASRAVAAARAAGMRVAVGGHRVRSAGGFDAVILRRSTAALELSLGECPLVIAVGLESPDDIEWARSSRAILGEGPAVAKPIRMAPVDVRHLQR